jgi:hypothetical protein
MVDRKRRNSRPTFEPMDRRELLSGLMIALQAPVPDITPTQEVAIASNLGKPAPAGTASSQATSTSNPSGVYIGATGPNSGATFPASPILGTGTPTAAELAREKFVAKFSGPSTVQPARFSDQKEILYLRGLGGSTPNFFLHGDYSLAIVIPAGFNPANPTATGPVTGFAFLDDKNNNSGGVVGFDLLATQFDAQGRPTQLTFTADPNVYGGIFYSDSAEGTVSITYGKNSATTVFNGRIYTSGLTSPFQNTDLYAKHSG